MKMTSKFFKAVCLLQNIGCKISRSTDRLQKVCTHALRWDHMRTATFYKSQET